MVEDQIEQRVITDSIEHFYVLNSIYQILQNRFLFTCIDELCFQLIDRYMQNNDHVIEYDH